MSDSSDRPTLDGPTCEEIQWQFAEAQEEIRRLRQANENNLEGWAQDRAGLERRYLRAEDELRELRLDAEAWRRRADERGNTWRRVRRLLKAAQAVVREWDERGDGRVMKRVEEELREAVEDSFEEEPK